MPDTSPPNPEATMTANEQQLAASIDALLAAGSQADDAASETPATDQPHPITASAPGPEQAVQSVEDLLADVAAELTATQPAAAPQAAAGPAAPVQPLDSMFEQVAADLADQSSRAVPPTAPSSAAAPVAKSSTTANPPAVDKVEAQLAAIASELNEQIETAEAAADKSDSASVRYELATSPSSATVTGPAPSDVHTPPAAAPAPRPPMPEPAVSIEELDQTLADVAEQVLADDQSNSAAARIDAAQHAAAAPPAAEPAAAAAAPAPPAAPSADPVIQAPSAEKPVDTAAPLPEVRQPSKLAPLGQRVLLAISNAASRLSPTVRQTIGWLAIYTALLAIGVWGYLLLRGEAKPMEATSEPVPFLQPGEHAAEPKPKAAGHAAEPADSHGKSGEKPPAKDSHGAAKKPDSKASDSHGAKSAKASAKKPPEKKKTDKKAAEHH